MTNPTQLGATMLKALVKLREQKGAIRIEDLGEILAEVATTIPTSNQPGVFLRGEFQKIAEHIDQAKLEIASLVHIEGEEAASMQHISHATNQLDAVVKATEEATTTIMDSADKIQQAVDNNAPDMKDIIGNAVADIYLACNFQDITGQRITKVLNTLNYIDLKVRTILQLFGEVSAEDAEKAAQLAAENPLKDTRPDASLLNGPQMQKDAPSQDDIDALFASIQ
jgi:chemotaxis protein CheZ